MKLDYQIRHLLVDEFQDTSQGQYRLLERLTAGWSGQDGRTLFVVGDPMQSIYRFREAEVGLFLQAQREGIGRIPLTPLTLTVNFRSQAALVAWINGTFPTILPATDHMEEGAVRFHPSVPFRPASEETAVTVHPFLTDDPQAEAARVVDLARHSLAANQKTAILVRSRAHLQSILPALTQAGLRYQGIDLESLAHSMVIQDLLSLTRALLYPADRIAWLAILRAPWCGLSLDDLTKLAQWSPGTEGEAPEADPPPITLWEALSAPKAIALLSEEGQWRLNRVVAVLAEAIRQRRRSQAFPGIRPLSFWVEHTWQALGGPATVPQVQGLTDARQFFDLLATTERGGDLPDLPGFADRVAALYAGVDQEADDRLLVMTIHKAKGLEFDTVILPGLGRIPRSEDKPLLSWMTHSAGLILGPLKRVDQEQEDPIHAYIRHIETRKGGFEAGRLLYVAATRARQQLHLLGHVKEAESPPPARSFLHLLWPQVADRFAPTLSLVANPLAVEAAGSVGLRRLALDWSPPPPPPPFRAQTEARAVEEEPVEFEWAGETVRLVGIVVHRFLHTLTREGLAHWTPQRIEARQPAFAAHLDRLGLPSEQEERAVGMVRSALLNTVTDERGRWILDNDRHEQPASELALTGLIHGQPRRLVLDRTFIDREGVRWIIDFKTSWHQGMDLDGFLDNERVRYQEQMARYGLLMQRVSDHPVRLGLYFPMHTGWRAWGMSGD